MFLSPHFIAPGISICRYNIHFSLIDVLSLATSDYLSSDLVGAGCFKRGAAVAQVMNYRSFVR